nr:hypothetical protein [Micromonospora craterilacus]
MAAVALAGYGVLGVRALLRRRAAAVAARVHRERLDQLCALAADLRAGLPVMVAAEALGLARPSTAVIGGPAAPLRSGEPLAEADRPDAADRIAAVERVAASGGARRPGRAVLSSEGFEVPDAPVPPDADALPDRPGRLARAAVRLADRTGAPLAELVERIEADARSTDRGLAAAGAQAAGARATAWLLAALPLGGIGLGYGIGVDPLDVLLHTPIGGGCAIAAVALQVVGLLWAERLGTVPTGGS